jgi:S-methylmethionine-dependent homocysteine/selenocysteine methylase
MKHIFKEKKRVAIGSDPSNRRFLSAGNLESTLAMDYHVDLTHNAAFELLYTREGRMIMQQYHELYLQLAERYQLTYILETPTWRANRDWIYRLGYKTDETAAVNRHAVQFIRETEHSKNCDVIISGSVGPRQDDFDRSNAMSPDESAQYHSEQLSTFALLDVDIITARALNDSDEAIGVVKACRALGIPVVISFRVDNEGNLRSGEPLGKAITRVDQETRDYTTYFALNCIGIETLQHLASGSGLWKGRLHGIQTISHSNDLDMRVIKLHFPNLKVLGGCGFDFTTLDDLCRKFIAG